MTTASYRDNERRWQQKLTITETWGGKTIYREKIVCYDQVHFWVWFGLGWVKREE